MERSGLLGTAKGYNNDYADLDGRWTDSGNNINQDPRFVGPADGDVHLRLDSPCIDTGENDAPELPSLDLEGISRIVDGDDDGSATVDMGADEFVFQTDVLSGKI